MTIASLIVKLDAETSAFHRKMEEVARRVERTGRQITRAGIEISHAISLPLIAAGFGAFHAALEDSRRSFGPLFTAFEQLKAWLHEVAVAAGRALTPAFLQLIGILTDALRWIRGLVDAFNQLSPGMQKAIVDTLLFLAALGPAVVIIGKFVKVIGSIPALLAALTSPVGLAVLAIGALVAAAIAIVTHWQQVKVIMLEVWRAIVSATTTAIDAMLGGIVFLVGWIPKLGAAVKETRAQFEAWRDSVLAGLTARIDALAKGTQRGTRAVQQHGAMLEGTRQILDAYSNSAKAINFNTEILGAEFNRNAASAARLKQVLDALATASPEVRAQIEAQLGPAAQLAQAYTNLAERGQLYGQALDAFGPTLEDHMRLLQAAAELGINLDTITKEQLILLQGLGKQYVDLGQSIRDGVGSAFEALGTRLGQIFAGMTHGFHNFGAVMEQLLGNMLVTLGQVLIAYGTAGIAIKKFIANPFAAIAAGVALIALGSALSAAAQKTLNAEGAGPAAGPASAPTESPSGPAQPASHLVLELRGDGVIESIFRMPQNQDALAKVLRDLSGKDVIVSTATA